MTTKKTKNTMITKSRTKKSASIKATEELINQCAEVTNEMIALRAWEIWNREGCPHGRDFENWLQAESELQEELSS